MQYNIHGSIYLIQPVHHTHPSTPYVRYNSAECNTYLVIGGKELFFVCLRSFLSVHRFSGSMALHCLIPLLVWHCIDKFYYSYVRTYVLLLCLRCINPASWFVAAERTARTLDLCAGCRWVRVERKGLKRAKHILRTIHAYIHTTNRYILAPLQLMSTYYKTCIIHPITLVIM